MKENILLNQKDMKFNLSKNDWKTSNAEIFWGEIAPCDHVLQIYESDEIFMDALSGFVGAGINSGDSCIVIATEPHLKALDEKLKECVIRTEMLIATKRFIPLNAEEVLSRFMVNGWPDENLFNKTISGVIDNASSGYRKIRAFGEMVAVLWAQGHSGATLQLEHLWNKFCEKRNFTLFCAYPKTGFTKDINSSISHICGSHSKMIAGSKKQVTEIYYRDIIEQIA